MWFKKHRQARRDQAVEQERQELLALIEKAERRELTFKEYQSFGYSDLKLLDYDGQERGRAAWKLAEADQRFDDDRKQIRVAYGDLASAENLELQVYQLAAVIAAYERVQPLNRSLLEGEFGETVEQLRERLIHLVQQHYDELLAEYSHGISQLERLGKFIQETRKVPSYLRGMIDGRLKKAGAPMLSYPSDWNHLVARFYETPTVDQFDLRSMNSNEVALLAEQTTRCPDTEQAFTDAQIVLAFCRYEPTRAHIGDILFTKLVEIINVYRVSTASVEPE